MEQSVCPRCPNEKLALLSRMRDIAHTQMELIENDRPEEFARAMEKRERLIRRIDKLDADSNADAGQQEELRRIVGEILAIDRRCASAAKGKLAFYRTRVKAGAQSAKQLDAYANPYCAAGGMYLDMKK